MGWLTKIGPGQTALAVGGGLLPGAGDGPGGQGRRVIPWLLTLALLAGLVLRLGGVGHGLPDIIAHCDTPKQLDLISQFLSGDLIPPASYPLGHIYLYTALLKALLTILPLEVAIPNLSSENIAECAHVIVTARVMQAILGAAIPWLAFLAARRLWDAWTGLLAALLLACDPVHLTYSWQMMGEVPQTFWVMLSFLGAVRILQGGGLGAYLLAGLAAGLAVATKMYGGYVVLAALAAHLLGRRDCHWRLLALAAALLAGAALGTPHVWLDPAGWWANFWAESAAQYGAGADAGPQEGLKYLVRALVHRFSWAWLLGGLLGLVFLGLRHTRADLLLLVPAACSLGLVLGFRLGYLREWDLVNLTPYLSLALAAAARRLWLQYARQWLARHLPPGSGLLADLPFSAGYARWADRVVGLEFSDTKDLAYLLGKEGGKANIPVQALALERAWWQPPLVEKLLRPVQVFKLRNTYWEDPEIRLYLAAVPDHRPLVLLPHVRVQPPQAVFWHTPWARRQVLDLLLEPGRGERLVHAPGPLGPLGYVALGQGRTSLSWGQGRGQTLEARPGQLLMGLCEPLRSLLPLDPPTYRLGLGQGRGVGALWVGLYQRPELMLPLLARFGQWPQMELALAQDAGHGQPAAESLLWLAAAQAAQGQEPAAQQTLERLDGGNPGFIAEYARLARQDQAGALAVLGRLATATPEMLLNERLCWSRRGQCQPPEPPERGYQIQALGRADGFHLWLPQAFLPGFLSLRLEVGTASGQPGRARP
ncbi:MAG: glycosyltransferase family 39 protein, partial [Desulfarculus sp.]|nr:glycosyltransferase family 39 protein [Desulfarculus sp.]